MVEKPQKRPPGSETDTDFQASDDESDDADEPEGKGEDAGHELDDANKKSASRSKFVGERSFKRAEMPLVTPRSATLPNGRSASVGSDDGQYFPCIACNERHDTGYCPLKMAGVEYCNLCGLPHYGIARTCPHFNSVTQLRAMVEALKRSNEPHDLKEAAKKRIVGIIGDLNQRKRKKHEAQQAQNMSRPLQNMPSTVSPNLNQIYHNGGPPMGQFREPLANGSQGQENQRFAPQISQKS